MLQPDLQLVLIAARKHEKIRNAQAVTGWTVDRISDNAVQVFPHIMEIGAAAEFIDQLIPIGAHGVTHILEVGGIGPCLEIDTPRDAVPEVHRGIVFEPSEARVGIHLGPHVVRIPMVPIPASSHDYTPTLLHQHIVDHQSGCILAIVRSELAAKAEVHHSGTAQCFGFFENELDSIHHRGGKVRSTGGIAHDDQIGLRRHARMHTVRRAATSSDPGHGSAVSIVVGGVHLPTVDVRFRPHLAVTVLRGRERTVRHHLVPIFQHTRIAVGVLEIGMCGIQAGIHDPHDHTFALIGFRQRIHALVHQIDPAFHPG